jgi:hypothetical protein
MSFPDPSTWAGRLARRPASWLILSLICLLVDFALGPTIQFPVVYLVPISLASWYGSRRWGLALALLLPLFRLYYRTLWEPPWSLAESAANAGIRMTVFAGFAWLINRTAQQMRDLERMHLLEGLVGVCSDCKKIRDVRDGAWQPLDDYVARHPAEFERDVCPECAKRVREVFDRR